MSWAANQSFTSQTTITTSSSSSQQRMQQEGSQENAYFHYNIPVQYNQEMPAIMLSSKSQEFRADAKVQRLANAMRREVEMFQGPFREYVAESYRLTPDQTYHIKVRVAPGKTIELAVYSSE
ncbi:uncharacterized protein LOC129592245 [Paramacrobiotus metropolitanus]|uniref:uncharacterized protein LOC129592245 n=1 Tax=Paramacrobiotus metropolitanus TaxID=2943436 RepID=UPI002445B9CA|nr:uncharacterized protein LOC129592245 [Paramacrobiotus metropolitanus]XP_055344203.1 uncharacterized protein LOC129592245 [Paramacrobiotus metropolitanus]